MKKFLVFVMIAVVALGIGFTTFRFTVKQQIIKVDTTAIECNQGDTFALDIQIKNKKKDTTVTAVSNNSDIVALSNAAGDEYKFEAKRGGKATITVSSRSNPDVKAEITINVTEVITEPPTVEPIKIDDPTYVQGITLNHEELEISVGYLDVAYISYIPSTAIETGVEWTSSDESIATVSESGKVTGVSKGETKVLVYTQNGICKSATITVK